MDKRKIKLSTVGSSSVTIEVEASTLAPDGVQLRFSTLGEPITYTLTREEARALYADIRDVLDLDDRR